MPEQKTKLLFVIAHLVQSGSERFTYEICKNIDRDRFEVELLTKWRVRPNDYYYQKILDVGIRIHRRLPILLNRIQRHARPFFLLFRPVLEMFHRWIARISMGDLLDRFDVINAIQIENYYLLQPLLKPGQEIVTYLMGNSFQYRFDPYEDCVPDRRYRFVVTDPTQVADYERAAACRGADMHFFPLALDLSQSTDVSSALSFGEPADIGVFMRLGADRPISGLFKALAVLRRQRNVRLRVWGRGNPARFEKELRELGIERDVIFEGHTPDMQRTVRDSGLAMVWMTCNGPTIGYASIEVASFAVPMLFWNLSDVPDDEVRSSTGGNIRCFADPEDLARATAEMLADSEKCRESGRKLREYVLDQYDMQRHIGALEDYLLSVAARNSSRNIIDAAAH